jgi:hypothetical protein
MSDWSGPRAAPGPGVSGSQGRPGAAHARYSAGPYHEGPHTLVALLGVIWGRIRRLWG